MTATLRRFSNVLVAAAIAAGALLVVGLTPAHAYTCGYDDANAYISHPELALSFSFEEQCSDGLARVRGTIYDTLCDGRMASATISVYRRATDLTPLWRNTAKAQNGCGSSASFTFSGPSPGLSGWKLGIHMVACSTDALNCSPRYTHSYYG